MKNLFIIILLFISMCLWTQNVPQTIDYQGRLADSDGNYLNGVTTIEFFIYDVESGGMDIWSEYQDVSISNGIFHVLLGSVTPFPPDLFDGAVRWLELVVGGETLSPRTSIASVPFSIKAETAYTLQNMGSGSGLDADLLDGLDSSDFMLTCTIGDFAQGGVAFWVDETGQHGLVCAKQDQSTSMRWYAGTFGYTRANGDGPLAGEMNTAIIIASQVSIGDDGSTYAARICAELQVTEGGKTYGDWYLPSKEELNLMYQNKATIDATAIANGGSGFASYYYWSSTEYYWDLAWRQDFVTGYQTAYFDGGKGCAYYVRAVRAF